MERGESGSCVTYDAEGAIQRFYFPDRLIRAGFAWHYEDEECEAVAAGIHTGSPTLYYRAAGGGWKAYPISGFDAFTQEELSGLELLCISAEQSAVTVTVAVTRDGESVRMSFEIFPDAES